ncbi:MAG: TRAP transporter small permease [SAR324 cluster bacterium]|nr:TRAP transporter small permease [SAR324 cluster bacterium]
MNELLGLLLAIVVIGALVALAAKAVNRVAWRIESALSLVSSGIILAAMLFVSAEVISRKLFNAPIPGHLELSELLMPAIIFLAVAYTQSTGGHVRMTLFIHRLEPVTRRYVEIAIRLLSVLIYAVLCYYSAKHAYRSWVFDDVTMSPPYFLIWPSAIMPPIGIFLVTLRVYLEILHLAFPALLPATEPGLASAGTNE